MVKLKKQKFFMQALLSLSLLMLPVVTTYADTQSTTETTVTTTTTPAAVEQTTQTTTERRADYDTRGRSTGILGGALHVVGAIISFPFIVIGKVLQAIF